MSVISIDNDRAFYLYKSLAASLPASIKHSVSIVVVQHLVSNTIPLIDVLSELFNHVVVIPKPKSINSTVNSNYERRDSNIHIVRATRGHTGKPDYFRDRIVKHIENDQFIILDVGGYFSDSFFDIASMFPNRLLGIIEDTENGHQKYDESLDILLEHERVIPIYSVARSPLKEPEDHLVGQSIVYSIERILRDNNSLLTNKRALVIGYGKIGKSIASSLSSKNVNTWVFDIDPIRRSQALSHGFYTPERDYALQRVDLVIGATGKKSLKFNNKNSNCDFYKLKDHCFIASVTSADDEFDFNSINTALVSSDTDNGLSTFTWNDNDRCFHLLNGGNAVNFKHNNTLGPYIYLVACEIVACICRMIKGSHGASPFNGLIELKNEDRRQIAEAWIGSFLGKRGAAK